MSILLFHLCVKTKEIVKGGKKKKKKSNVRLPKKLQQNKDHSNPTSLTADYRQSVLGNTATAQCGKIWGVGARGLAGNCLPKKQTRIILV